MRVMLADYDAMTVGYWACKYPDKVGWLVGPTSRRMRKVPQWMPFSCDNDGYICYTNEIPWSESKFYTMLDYYEQVGLNPGWILVPDEVGNRNETIRKWHQHSERISRYGWDLAFAAQDGMTPNDVPDGADVVFVGGTTEWKWRSARSFCGAFPRVHIGRVNTIDRLWMCNDMGAESIDGTGWFRDGEMNQRLQKLEHFFENRREAELFVL